MAHLDGKYRMDRAYHNRLSELNTRIEGSPSRASSTVKHVFILCYHRSMNAMERVEPPPPKVPGIISAEGPAMLQGCTDT